MQSTMGLHEKLSMCARAGGRAIEPEGKTDFE
jgi:hypothetical protein